MGRVLEVLLSYELRIWHLTSNSRPVQRFSVVFTILGQISSDFCVMKTQLVCMLFLSNTQHVITYNTTIQYIHHFSVTLYIVLLHSTAGAEFFIKLFFPLCIICRSVCDLLMCLCTQTHSSRGGFTMKLRTQ